MNSYKCFNSIQNVFKHQTCRNVAIYISGLIMKTVGKLVNLLFKKFSPHKSIHSDSHSSPKHAFSMHQLLPRVSKNY